MGKKQGYIVYGFLKNPGEVYSYFPSRGKNIQEKRKREMKRKREKKGRKKRKGEGKKWEDKLKKGSKGKKNYVKRRRNILISLYQLYDFGKKMLKIFIFLNF